MKACALIELCRSSYYRTVIDWRQRDAAVIDALHAELNKSLRAGFWKCFGRLRYKGYPFNYKRVYRVYCRMGLNLKRRSERVLPKRIAHPFHVDPKVEHPWALDFMHDGV